MQKLIVLLFLVFLCLTAPLFAATVGGPEMSIPEKSLFVREEVINRTLDRYEYNMNMKVGMDIEIVTKRKLVSSPADTPTAEVKGQNYMFKFSQNICDIFEPYVKVGSSIMETKWTQYGNDVEVESKPGFAWGVGAKAKLYELKNYGIRLTLDAQYRDAELDVDKAMIGGSIQTASASNATFEIKEWQATLLGSKKIIFPLGINDCYLVPYAGITYSLIDVDVGFTQSTNGILYSTFNASDDNTLGIVMGCDIMPFFLSYYLLNFEIRLINETAFTLGGTIKF